MSEMNEFKLRVPSDLTRRFKGLSIDIGSSVAKFVYRTKQDQEDSSADGKYAHLHLVSFPRRELSTALEYVRQHAVITPGHDEADRPIIYTTGVGCTQQGKLVCDTLGIKLQQLTEFDCFVKSFAYLAAHLPRSDLIEPFLDEAIVEPLEHVQKQFEIMKKSKELLTSGDALELNEDAFMAGMKMATGKPPEADLPAKDV